MRLFVALWPQPDDAAAIARWRDACRWPPAARIVDTARLHLTLHFLGGVAAERLDELSDAIALPGIEVELEFGDFEVWRGGIAVLLPRALPPALTQLQQRLGEAIAGIGLPLESRPWRPHVTLARRADGAEPPPDAPPLRWRAAGHALVWSSGGYRVLRHYR